MPTLVLPAATHGSSIADDQSVLLWQACAYVDDVTDAARDGRPLAESYDALRQFLRDRLLPYLSEEERRILPGRLRDDHLANRMRVEHARLRADVATIEDSISQNLLALATETFVVRLERHVHRESEWVTRSDNPDADQADTSRLAPCGSSWV